VTAVKRSLIAVALFLPLLAGVLVAAQAPAAAASGDVGCRDTVVVNNGHGRLVVHACVWNQGGSNPSTHPGEQTSAGYLCYRSGSVTPQPCNITATQDLWYNATRVESDDGHACCGQVQYYFGGTLAGCTTAQIKTVVKNIVVRFSDQSLWSTSNTASSAIVSGSSNLDCLA